MPDKQQIKDIINWDTETWKEILPEWLKHLQKKDPLTTACAEVGSREGGISLWVALNGYKITCTDIHYDLVEAKLLHKKHGVSGMVEYKEVDLLKWNEPEKYDVVIFKSVLGALQHQSQIQKAVDNIYRNLKKGGIVLFAENSRGSLFHQVLRKKFTDWGSNWFYFDRKSIKTIFSAFEIVSTKYNGVVQVFGNRTFLKPVFTLVDRYLLNRIAPDSMKYIVFGCLKKN